MAVSAYSEMRMRLRDAIRDTYSTQWDDTALDVIIYEAVREYSLFSGENIKRYNLYSNEENMIFLPYLFFEPVKVISDGKELPIVSWKKLQKENGCRDFTKVIGNKAEAICFNYHSFGIACVYPKIPAGKKIGELVYRAIYENGIMPENKEAVEAHCLYQLNLLTSKKSTGAYWQKFLDLVNKKARSVNTLRNKRNTRRGVYY